MKVRSNSLRSCRLLVHGVEVEVDASGRFDVDEAEARYLAGIPGYAIDESGAPEVLAPTSTPETASTEAGDVADEGAPAVDVADDDKPKRGKRKG